jgi:hypothetical protein
MNPAPPVMKMFFPFIIANLLMVRHQKNLI